MTPSAGANLRPRLATFLRAALLALAGFVAGLFAAPELRERKLRGLTEEFQHKIAELAKEAETNNARFTELVREFQAEELRAADDLVESGRCARALTKMSGSSGPLPVFVDGEMIGMRMPACVCELEPGAVVTHVDGAGIDSGESLRAALERIDSRSEVELRLRDGSSLRARVRAAE
jgi:hypothetical protein